MMAAVLVVVGRLAESIVKLELYRNPEKSFNQRSRWDRENCSECAVQQKFPVAFSSQNRRLDYFGVSAVLCQECLTNFFDRGHLRRRVAHNAAFPDLLAAGFKLWFHQHNNLPSTPFGSRVGKSRSDHRRQNQGCGNEGNIHDDQVHDFANLLLSEVTGVSLLQQSDALILTEAKIDLPIARVHRNDAGCPVLQQAVGEPAGRGADIQTDFAANLDMPMLESLFQLEAATTDVLQVFAQESEVGLYIHAGAGLLDFLSINQHFASEDQGLRALARGCHAALQEQFVESDFQSVLRKSAYHVLALRTPLKCQQPAVCKEQKHLSMSYLQGYSPAFPHNFPPWC